MATTAKTIKKPAKKVAAKPAAKKAAPKKAAAKSGSKNTEEAKSRFNAALNEAKAGAAALKEEAKERASSFKTGAKTRASDYSGKAKDKSQDWAKEAKTRASDLAQEGKAKASEALDSISKIVSDNAAILDDNLGEKYGDYARKAADKLKETSTRIEEKDLSEVGEDVREFVRKSPAVAVGLAAVAGFFFARMVSGRDDD